MRLRIINPPASYQHVLSRLTAERVVDRIWAHDYTVWDPRPEEIANRLGWLDLPESMDSQLPRIHEFVESVRKDGFTHAVLLGMGGSSLAPETLSQVFATRAGYPQLRILDSTHPDSVRQAADEFSGNKTLFIVATKSGTTTETLSLFRYFHRRTLASVGVDRVGERFIAITDPGTPLAEIASQQAFRDTFLNDPNLGGRYSALSMFGLVPAALLGLDVEAFLRIARSFAELCSPATAVENNPAVQLGSVLGAWAREGRDKASILLSRPIEALGDWIEQLLAESTGKDGTGIVPVLDTSLGRIESYGQDRVFIAVRMEVDPEMDSLVSRLEGEHMPIVAIDTGDASELSEQFYLWEFATAIACHVLGVHPFNQPNVESAKRLAERVADESRRAGSPALLTTTRLSHQAISEFLSVALPGDYISLHAYLPQTEGMTAALRSLQAAIRDRYEVAVTLGFGPRFLHSTGQLHKGDRGNGHFIQLVSEAMPDVPIPDSIGSADSSLTFGALITSQAWGDRQALENAGRPVLSLSIPERLSESIRAVATCLCGA
ncbi:glucose-6-phosphate isomerase [Candidatus Bipolaricaulota bacterium]